MATEGSKMGIEKYSALIVDDLSIIRTLEVAYLKNRGFQTMAVENGKEAVDLFAAGKSFDVVLMDLEMPIMNGVQATKEIRALGVKSLIYGVTSADKEAIQRFRAAGLDECFVKPLDDVMIDKILDRLHKYE